MPRFFLVFTLLFLPLTLYAQDRDAARKLDEKISVRTTGGIWFWGDIQFFHEYHIQENLLTRTFRLLDGKSVLRAHGALEDCRRRLDEIQSEEGLLPMTGTAVIILHGFGSNALTTRHLAEWLRDRKAYDYVFNMAYPSTMQSILDHARMLQSVVDNLPPTISRIDFVGHSLGSIVMRRYLSGPLDPDWRVPEDRMVARKDFKPDRRIGRFVMLGPPNHGAEIAVRLIGRDPLRRRFTGKSGDELGIHWAETEKSLGIPCCPFGIISGGRGDLQGFSNLIPGDDDGIVSVDGTRLDGAEQWIQFLVGHGELLMTEEVFECTLRFLKTGTFDEPEK